MCHVWDLVSPMPFKAFPHPEMLSHCVLVAQNVCPSAFHYQC